MSGQAMVAIRPSLIDTATTAIGSVWPANATRQSGGMDQTGRQTQSPLRLLPQSDAPPPPTNLPRGSLLDLTV